MVRYVWIGTMLAILCIVLYIPFRVVVQNIPGRFNALFASDHLKSKLKIYQALEVPAAEQNMMQYFITNFRKEPKTVLKRCRQKLWHAEVQGSDVIAIYQLKGQEDCYE